MRAPSPLALFTPIAVAVGLAVPATAHAQACPAGMVSNASTEGMCCWRGQHFSEDAGTCVGRPRCPAGTKLEKTGPSCAPANPAAWHRRQCEAGHTANCTAEGSVLYFAGSGESNAGAAASYFRRGCDGGDPRGCLELHRALDKQDAPKAERDAALARGLSLTEKGCIGDHVQDCATRAHLLLEREDAASRRRARDIAARACTAHHNDACHAQLSAMEALGDADAAVRQAASWCEAGSAEFCATTGDMLQLIATDPIAVAPQRIYYYDKGCDLGSAFACGSLGTTLESTRRQSERGRIVAAYQRACDLGFKLNCQFAKNGGSGYYQLTDEDRPPVVAAPISEDDTFTKDRRPRSMKTGGPDGHGALLLAKGPPSPEREAACEDGDVQACEDVGQYWESPKYSARHIGDDAPPPPAPDRKKAEHFAHIGCDLGSLDMCALEGNLRVERYKVWESKHRR